MVDAGFVPRGHQACPVEFHVGRYNSTAPATCVSLPWPLARLRRASGHGSDGRMTRIAAVCSGERENSTGQAGGLFVRNKNESKTALATGTIEANSAQPSRTLRLRFYRPPSGKCRTSLGTSTFKPPSGTGSFKLHRTA